MIFEQHKCAHQSRNKLVTSSAAQQSEGKSSTGTTLIHADLCVTPEWLNLLMLNNFICCN